MSLKVSTNISEELLICKTVIVQIRNQTERKDFAFPGLETAPYYKGQAGYFSRSNCTLLYRTELEGRVYSGVVREGLEVRLSEKRAGKSDSVDNVLPGDC